MSHCTNFFSCLFGDPDFETVVKALMLKDDEGNDYINACYTDKASCEGLEAAFECLETATLRDVLELIIGQDDCGNPMINLIGNICENCTEEEVEDIR